MLDSEDKKWLDDYSKERVVANPEGLNVRSCFEVYECDNGYMARLRDGTVVVGKTMSECCESAQARMATIRMVDEQSDKMAQAIGSVERQMKESAAKAIIGGLMNSIVQPTPPDATMKLSARNMFSLRAGKP